MPTKKREKVKKVKAVWSDYMKELYIGPTPPTPKIRNNKK